MAAYKVIVMMGVTNIVTGPPTEPLMEPSRWMNDNSTKVWTTEKTRFTIKFFHIIGTNTTAKK